jgi:hypothetical protein
MISPLQRPYGRKPVEIMLGPNVGAALRNYKRLSRKSRKGPVGPFCLRNKYLIQASGAALACGSLFS